MMSITIHLPTEILVQIFNYLPQPEILKMRQVCQRFNAIVDEFFREKLLNTTFVNSGSSSTTLFFCNYEVTKIYNPEELPQEDFLNEYTFWTRAQNCYYAVKDKIIYSGQRAPLVQLVSVDSAVNLVWINVNSRFIATINEGNQVSIYLKRNLKLLNGFTVPEFRFIYLLNNHLFFIDRSGWKKCDFAGRIAVANFFLEYEVPSLSFINQRLVYNSENAHIDIGLISYSTFNIINQIMGVEGDEFMVKKDDGSVVRLRRTVPDGRADMLASLGFVVLLSSLPSLHAGLIGIIKYEDKFLDYTLFVLALFAGMCGGICIYANKPKSRLNLYDLV